jgi:predicted nucleic acid-binding protein
VKNSTNDEPSVASQPDCPGAGAALRVMAEPGSKTSARFFLDTNVLIYSFDIESRIKQKRACDLIDAALTAHQGVISYQVVQEFLNAAIRKFARVLSENEAQLYSKRVLMPLCHVFPDDRLYSQALSISSEVRVSFYDALIISSALVADCSILWTEDLQHGRRIGNLEIRDPFRA